MNSFRWLYCIASRRTIANIMMPLMVPRKPTSKATTFRLTEEARRLLAEIAERQGIDKTAALETIIREIAEKRGIK